MLILQRKPGESLVIGNDITVSIVSVENGRVQLAIDAPREVPILRSELLAAIAVNQESVVDQAVSATALLEFLSDLKPPVSES